MGAMENPANNQMPGSILEPAQKPAPTAPALELPPVWGKRSIKGYIWALAVCIVVLYFLNNVLENYIMPFDPNISKDYPGFIVSIINNLAAMKVTFLTQGFISCLWAVNTALTIAILGYFTLLLFRPRWYHYLVQAVISLVAILPIYVMHLKFPFFFSTGSMTDHAKLALWVLMAIFAVGFVGEFIRFAMLRLRRDFS
jgi:magnesium-transporting ATPase (P-type)